MDVANVFDFLYSGPAPTGLKRMFPGLCERRSPSPVDPPPRQPTGTDNGTSPCRSLGVWAGEWYCSTSAPWRPEESAAGAAGTSDWSWTCRADPRCCSRSWGATTSGTRGRTGRRWEGSMKTTRSPSCVCCCHSRKGTHSPGKRQGCCTKAHWA